MNTPRLIIAAAALVIAGAAAQASDKPTRSEKGEARLAEMLKGRVAGEPVGCIPAFNSSQLQVIEGVALVYGSGTTIYVARPTQPGMMRWDDVLVINRVGGQMCNTDIIRTVDRMSGFNTGVVFLSKFVPYKKQD